MDPAKSRIGFSGTQVGAPFKGRFTRYDAQISFEGLATKSYQFAEAMMKARPR